MGLALNWALVSVMSIPGYDVSLMIMPRGLLPLPAPAELAAGGGPPRPIPEPIPPAESENIQHS